MKTKFFLLLVLITLMACKNEKELISNVSSADMLIKNKIWYVYPDTSDYGKYSLIKVKDNRILYNLNGMSAYEYKIMGDSIFLELLPNEFSKFYKFKIEFISNDSMVWKSTKHIICMRLVQEYEKIIGNWNIIAKNDVYYDVNNDTSKIYYVFNKDKTYRIDKNRFFNLYEKGTYRVLDDKIVLKSGNKETTVNYYFKNNFLILIVNGEKLQFNRMSVGGELF
ncbi:MAG: hypothetical protein HPY79_00025 [Bacteroidales bacterium]|nr:hypothetical protein [Bacteroidales bacterium]